MDTRTHLLTHAADMGGWLTVTYPDGIDDGPGTINALAAAGLFRFDTNGTGRWVLTEPGAAVADELRTNR